MTHPLTPREKVEPSLGDLLRKAVETMKSWTPEQREAHFEAQKKAWVAAEMAFGDEGTRVVTALASGSGEHSGLRRLADEAADFGVPAQVDPAVLNAPLAEIAALRAERDGMIEEVSRSQARFHAATEAERKLAEAVGLLREWMGAWFVDADSRGESAIADDTRKFLNKEAERG